MRIQQEMLTRKVIVRWNKRNHKRQIRFKLFVPDSITNNTLHQQLIFNKISRGGAQKKHRLFHWTQWNIVRVFYIMFSCLGLLAAIIIHFLRLLALNRLYLVCNKRSEVAKIRDFFLKNQRNMGQFGVCALTQTLHRWISTRTIVQNA